MAMLRNNRAADSSLAVEESLWQNGPEVNRRFAERWRLVMPEDKPPPNMEHFTEFMALDLARTRGTMVVGAQEHEIETGGDVSARALRDHAHKKANASYLDGRDLYVSIYGRESAEAVGFAFPMEKSPTRLMRRMGTVTRSLGRLPDEPIPAPEGKEELAVKPSVIIGMLEPPRQELRQATRRMVTERRNAQKTKKVKDETFGEHIANFRTHAKCGEMIYRMVGLKREADQIKPSQRRPGRRAADEEQKPDADAPSAAETEVSAEDGAEAPEAP